MSILRSLKTENNIIYNSFLYRAIKSNYFQVKISTEATNLLNIQYKKFCNIININRR